MGVHRVRPLFLENPVSKPCPKPYASTTTEAPSNSRLVQVTVGEPWPGEIRIRHKAVGLNFIDVYQRSGLYPMAMPLQLGMEAAGVVEAVGEGVTHLQPGDRAAYASQPPGSYCECGSCPPSCVCKLPDAIDFRYRRGHDAQGPDGPVPAAQNAAARGLHAGRLCAVPCRSGRCGADRLPVGAALGLRLIGTAGSEQKCALALAHGAEFAINYRAEDFAVRVREITGGKGVSRWSTTRWAKTPGSKSLDCLAPFGLMASFGNASGPVAAFAPGILGPKGSLYLTRQTLFTHIATRESTQAMADDLFAVVVSGQVQVRIDQRYPLEAVQQAHRDLEARQTTGCTILTL
jgi:NADPH2:quinone reductase